MTRDYVIQTHFREEKIAHAALFEKDFDVTWLTVFESIRTKNSHRKIAVSLFPSYLFASFDIADDSWKRIFGLKGVKRILGRDPLRPHALPLGQVAQFRQTFQAGEFKKAPERGIAINDNLIIDAGPFAGFMGVCKMARGERIKVLMDILGSKREVDMWSGMARLAVS